MSGMSEINHRSETTSSLKVVFVYFVFSCVYIYASDDIVKGMVSDISLFSKIQTFKGLVFVIVSSLLLFFLVKRYGNTISFYYRTMDQQKQDSQEELKRSEEKYLMLFNIAPIPMWIFDPSSLKFLLVNEAACIRYGYTEDEFYGMTLCDIRPEEDIEMLHRAIAQTIGSKHAVFSKNVIHKRKDGSLMNVRIESIEITYDGKKARLIIPVDISYELAIQKQLETANQRLHSACEIANLGYWSNELSTGKIYWSDTLYELFGVNADNFELTMDNIAARFHKDDRKHLYSDLNRNFSNEEINEYEHRIIKGKGEERWILERIKLIRNEEGIPEKIEGVVLDITERKRSQQQIQKSNERFEKLSHAAFEAIIDWDIEENKVYWGNGFKELFGYLPDANNKHLWLKNIHHEDKQRVLNQLISALNDKTKASFYAEFRYFKADGTIAYVQQRGIFIRNEEGKAIRAVGAMIDITGSIEKMMRIEKQNEMLNKIAWIQSHEVRAPLATLMGLTCLLKDKKMYGISEEEVIDNILLSANKLDRIIHEIEKNIAGTRLATCS